jgi:hypothetical protein
MENCDTVTFRSSETRQPTYHSAEVLQNLLLLLVPDVLLVDSLRPRRLRSQRQSIDVEGFQRPLHQPDEDQSLVGLEVLGGDQAVTGARLARRTAPSDGLHSANQRLDQTPVVGDVVVVVLRESEFRFFFFRLGTLRRRQRVLEDLGRVRLHVLHFDVRVSVGGWLLALVRQDGQLDLGDCFKLDHEDFQHAHQQLSTLGAVLGVGSDANAVHEVQQELAGHGLYPTNKIKKKSDPHPHDLGDHYSYQKCLLRRCQSVIVDVLAEEVNCACQVRQRQLLPHVVDQIGQSGVSQRSERLVSGPASPQQNILVEQLLHVGDESIAQVGG